MLTDSRLLLYNSETGTWRVGGRNQNDLPIHSSRLSALGKVEVQTWFLHASTCRQDQGTPERSIREIRCGCSTYCTKEIIAWSTIGWFKYRYLGGTVLRLNSCTFIVCPEVNEKRPGRMINEVLGEECEAMITEANHRPICWAREQWTISAV